MIYISTYRVLQKGFVKVIIPSMTFLLVSVIISVFLISMEHNVYSIVGGVWVILSFIIFFILMQHLQLNWLIWAVKYVDNIPQFAKAGESYRLTQYNFPKLSTIFPYKKKKKEIENIVFERTNKKLLVVKNFNISHFSDVYFYNSFTYYGTRLLLGLFFLSVWLFVPSGRENSIKIICTIIGTPIVFFALRKLLNRNPTLSIGGEGVMIKKHNLKWNEIENIEVTRTAEGTGLSYTYFIRRLEVTYKEKNGILKTIKINIATLNTTVVELDEIIKSYKKSDN